MEKKQGDATKLSPVKMVSKKKKRESSFMSPNAITPIHGSGYKIIDSSILQEVLVLVSKCWYQCLNVPRAKLKITGVKITKIGEVRVRL